MFGALPLSVHLKFIAERNWFLCFCFVAWVVHIVCMLGPVEVLKLRMWFMFNELWKIIVAHFWWLKYRYWSSHYSQLANILSLKCQLKNTRIEIVQVFVKSLLRLSRGETLYHLVTHCCRKMSKKSVVIEAHASGWFPLLFSLLLFLFCVCYVPCCTDNVIKCKSWMDFRHWGKARVYIWLPN